MMNPQPIFSFLKLLRPVNTLAGALTVAIGFLLHRQFSLNAHSLTQLGWGMAGYFFISSASMIMNDYYDLEIDRINKPYRPLPRGKISLAAAFGSGLFLYLIGNLIAAGQSLFLKRSELFLIAFVFSLLGFLYAARLKRSGFSGNLLVSASFPFGLFYGRAIPPTPLSGELLFFFLTAFLLLLCREIVKGIEDLEGDRHFGVKTLACLYGRKSTAIFSVILSMLTLLAFTFTVSRFPVNLPILILALSGGLAILFSIKDTAFGFEDQRKVRRSSRFLLLASLIGLLTFLGLTL